MAQFTQQRLEPTNQSHTAGDRLRNGSPSLLRSALQMKLESCVRWLGKMLVTETARSVHYNNNFL